jgi:hypothetical protein
VYQFSFSSIREWIRDLIFGRAIPKKYRYMTVEVSKSPLPIVQEKAKPAIKLLNGERIIGLPFEDPAQLTEFIESHKNMVYRYMLKRFELAIQNKKKNVVLFQFGNSKKIARVLPEGYRLQLTKMLQHFVQIEDYESASRCRDLIGK